MAGEPGPGPTPLLRGRLGRRLFVLFLLCAIAPLLGFAWLASSLLSTQLHKDSETSLHDSVKSAGMNLAGKLLLLRDELDTAADELRSHGTAGFPAASPVLLRRLQGSFRALALHAGAATTVLFGDEAPVPEPDAEGRDHLAAGRTLLRRCARVGVDGPWRMALLRRLRPDDAGSPLLAAVIQDGVLWCAEDLGAPRVEVAVYDRDFTDLYWTSERPAAGAGWRAQSRRQPAGGTFAWQVDGNEHLARYWRLFLKPQFGADLWVVHSWPRERVLAPLEGFQDTFLLVALVAFVCVVAASRWQLRRTLRPIAELHLATEAVAAGDLATVVPVDSADEIGDLARAFNRMAANLQANIQRRERSERELVAAHERALAAAKAKADFLTNVSHEFRTPLAAVLSMAEVLGQAGDDDPAVRAEFVAGIVDRTRHLGALIEQVLELTTNGRRRSVACDVAATLRVALAAVPAADRTRVRLELADGLPAVTGDPDRLVALWGHLLDNALKFSAADTAVEVAACAAGDRCLVEVTDHGCGIPAEHQQQIFDAFHQVTDDHLTAKVPGTGLGLTLALEIAREHGGDIEVDSSPGHGSRFRVRLPAATGVPVAG